MDDFKRSHVPAFGNWDYEDGLPITQYFESARQAGLFRYTYNGEADLYSCSGYDYEQDLYKKPATITVVPRRKMKTKEADYQPHVTGQRKQRKVYDVEQTARQRQQCQKSKTVLPSNRAPKAVDEDLYKIPPELLYSSYPKKKITFGFFSRCLVPSCAA
ncbi:hypothetical protein IFM89_023927 [Coptis chinensis]|uniref:Uncharacterized protein n=1 Tax=Coptis chinensis TaxID=261450 RepID=A0A835I4V6_9MAGN|nr:hypothetical protein IFM89_023927 [Coptis chinensis]